MKGKIHGITRFVTTSWVLWVAFLLAGCSPSTQVQVTPTSIATPESIEELIEEGELDQAAQILHDTVTEEPNNAAALYQLGLISSILQPDQAAAQLASAARLDPSYQAHATRLQDALRQASSIQDPAYQLTVTAQALSSLQEWYLAQVALENAVEEDPEYAEAWAFLGEVRQHSGQENGLDALNTAYSLDPESYAANLFLSIYWQRQSQPKRALPYLQTALKLEPNNLNLQENLAQTLVDAGLVETGFETIEELTSQMPEEPEPWMMLARLSIENTIQVEEVGLPAARQAVLMDPKNAEAILLLGRAYLLTEQAILAERFFIQATQLDPQLAAPHLYLAIIYLNQENKQPAEPHLQEALSLAQASGNQVIADQAEQFLRQYFP